jgi:predicted nucleic acid-binding protein
VTDRPRAVLDTNIFVSAFLSRNPSSPTKELIQRWESGEFTLLVSDALVDEITEKLLERRIRHGTEDAKTKRQRRPAP